MLFLRENIPFLRRSEATLRAEAKLLNRGVAARSLYSAFDLVRGFEWPGFGGYETQDHDFAVRQEPKRLEAAGAVIVPFHEIAVDVDPVENEIRDRLVAAGRDKC